MSFARAFTQQALLDAWAIVRDAASPVRWTEIPEVQTFAERYIIGAHTIEERADHWIIR